MILAWTTAKARKAPRDISIISGCQISIDSGHVRWMSDDSTVAAVTTNLPCLGDVSWPQGLIKAVCTVFLDSSLNKKSFFISKVKSWEKSVVSLFKLWNTRNWSACCYIWKNENAWGLTYCKSWDQSLFFLAFLAGLVLFEFFLFLPSRELLPLLTGGAASFAFFLRT